MADILRFDAKAPTDRDFYALDWTDWLAQTPGDTIISATVSVSPLGLILDGAPVITGGSVGQWILGGSSGVDYLLSYTVITALGRDDTQQAMLLCGSRVVSPAQAIVSSLGARVLRKLGIAIVADASRPGERATFSSADIAARVLLELGLPVPEASRPGAAGIVSKDDLAARALRAVGIDPAGLVVGTSTGIVYNAAALATATLLKLTVIASDETPSATDQAEALARVNDVHDILSGADYVTWTADLIPAAVAEFYIMMAANLLAPQFGKAPSMDVYNTAQAMIRQQALSGAFGQSLAINKVIETHERLNALGLVSWAVDSVPLAQAANYVTLTASLLAPIYGYQQDGPGREASKQASDAAEAGLRRSAVIAGAQARAQAKVQAVQAELNDLGLVTWGTDAIPASVADAMASMAASQMGPEFGKDGDPKVIAFNQDRIRRISMGGPAGQALAEQKIRAVQYSLEARGRARWDLFDVPPWAEEPLVLMAAVLLAPECGVKADPNWAEMAERDLMRIVSLPSEREPVRATYF